jgi:hypothetical protein
MHIFRHQRPHPLLLLLCVCVSSRVSSLLQQPSDEPVAVRLVAFAAALLPVILASGLAYRLASGAALHTALYKVRMGVRGLGALPLKYVFCFCEGGLVLCSTRNVLRVCTQHCARYAGGGRGLGAV